MAVNPTQDMKEDLVTMEDYLQELDLKLNMEKYLLLLLLEVLYLQVHSDGNFKLG